MNIIFGIERLELTSLEKELFKSAPPYGIILFKRNCVDPKQVKALTQEILHVCGPSTEILIDQEGGRVARLKSPAFKEFPTPSSFLNPQSAYDNAVQMAHQLKDLGITVNCTPLADLCFPITHDVIGDRSFGQDPLHVGLMAQAVIKGHLDSGIKPVIKHLPGHGRALADSHKELPCVDTKQKELDETDFQAFEIALDGLDQTHIWGMTAHILYQDIDPLFCATQSKVIIQKIIRETIQFKGTLISDCVTMEALKGSYPERVLASLQAGCDLALHCNGNIEEMKQITHALMQGQQ